MNHSYPVPWRLVFGLTPYVRENRPRSVDDFTRALVSRMRPEPTIIGEENLPTDPRFLLVANHYQRPGLWILYPAAVLTQVIRRRYGPLDPPMRWIVTANWPPWKIGRWTIPSPGDRILPRVAKVLSCYSVSFAGTNPGFTARSMLRLFRDARSLDRPIGLFPEGVQGSAGNLVEPLPGVDRMIQYLSGLGISVLPVGIHEQPRLTFQIGKAITAGEISKLSNPATEVMSQVRSLINRSTELRS